ncbi:hypothetical protein [Kribbella sp. CA-293567]|uniref:hypothetical protein n=1 Tax=Kribbella sp. CA-293567 TaxID=3002436 RepID=UPI0022DDC4D8|nr:hypothetical protein [Kribbella sp. CA-293567]WBQ04749.1 hypothetical protein OX958_32920 [Kribbella sp. CA-293567]
MSKRVRQGATMVVALLLLPFAVACSSKASQCEKAFAAVANSVDGVASAHWDCSEQFGGGWQRGTVVLDVDTKAEAENVMETLLRAFAASPDLLDRWSTPQKYTTQDPAIVVAAGSLGFNGTPRVGEVRARFGITPG